MSTALTAQGIIRLLDLKPHPEGGHFRETFRDAPFPPAGKGGEKAARAASTAIYFCSHAASARTGIVSMQRRFGIGMRVHRLCLKSLKQLGASNV